MNARVTTDGRVLVLGGGAPGEHFVGALRRLDPDVPITLVERQLVGGECSYWACIPTKTMIRAPEVLASARLAPGAAEALDGGIDAGRVFAWRDEMASGRDDSGQEEWLASQNTELVRGEGRVLAPGRVAVGDRELTYDKLVIATGSLPVIPPVPGIEDVEIWTNRHATETTEVPDSLIVLGGGAVGCELAQFFRRVGSEVTLIQREPGLLPRVDAIAGDILLEAFRDDGIDVRLETDVERVDPGVRVTLAGGETLEAERLLVATGRKPNVEGFGFEQLGLAISRRGVEVDDRLAAARNVWALGDVTGIAQFTHVGKYQARVIAANIAGRDVRADYRAIPACIFTDPQVASVGRMDGDGLVSAEWNTESTSRTYTYEQPTRRGVLKVAADRGRGVIVGAVAVGPEAGEWLQQLTLAIRAEVPVDVVLDTIQPFPTFSESVFFAVQELELT
jgi:pyruvate/2-oxoglutarate dehydrogenase complex dihydrolipoamide dehydrogenase (E3) component